MFVRVCVSVCVRVFVCRPPLLPFCGFAQEDKLYVQHRMREHGARLVASMLDEEATVYVCGDGASMARDVEATVKALLREHRVRVGVRVGVRVCACAHAVVRGVDVDGPAVWVGGCTSESSQQLLGCVRVSGCGAQVCVELSWRRCWGAGPNIHAHFQTPDGTGETQHILGHTSHTSTRRVTCALPVCTLWGCASVGWARVVSRG